MITPQNPITIAADTADGIWITNIAVVAPSTTKPIKAVVTVAPYSSTTGTIFKNQAKTITFDDVVGTSNSNPSMAAAMESIFSAVQVYITTNGLF